MDISDATSKTQDCLKKFRYCLHVHCNGQLGVSVGGFIKILSILVHVRTLEPGLTAAALTTDGRSGTSVVDGSISRGEDDATAAAAVMNATSLKVSIYTSGSIRRIR